MGDGARYFDFCHQRFPRKPGSVSHFSPAKFAKSLRFEPVAPHIKRYLFKQKGKYMKTSKWIIN
jgi:hypothetical protein